jgi:hypothetical protein
MFFEESIFNVSSKISIGNADNTLARIVCEKEEEEMKRKKIRKIFFIGVYLRNENINSLYKTMLTGICNLVKHMLVKNLLVVTGILYMFKLSNKCLYKIIEDQGDGNYMWLDGTIIGIIF